MGMGEKDAEEIVRASLRGAELIRSLVPTHSEGWMLARDEREIEELKNLLALYEKWGVEGSWIKKSTILEHIPSGVMHGGIRVEAEGSLNPLVLAQTLLHRAMDSGVQLICSAKLNRIEDREGGSRLYHQQGTTDAEVVVYMQHNALAKIEPFFTTTLGTIRTQAISYVRSTPAMKQSCSAQYGYLSWRDEGTMRMISGCRWATPHLEIGEFDDSIVVSVIEKALIRTVRQCFLEEEVRIANRWSMIERRSCDGLPLVGPIPGRDHLISCTAFQGRLLGLGFAAAESISELLLNGVAKHLPSSFSLRRFLL
jgi:glycine/D-amino acid oxidase-like deaminating enzyme